MDFSRFKNSGITNIIVNGTSYATGPAGDLVPDYKSDAEAYQRRQALSEFSKEMNRSEETYVPTL